jgi:hypothetical protein
LDARWAALDPADQQRPLVLIAHGPTAEAEAERWVADLSLAAIPALQRAVAAIRDTVQRLAAASEDSVEGLAVRYVPTPLAPRPALARWIERIAHGRASAND